MNKKILIIEDDLILLNLLRDKLKNAGYNIVIEKNGASSINAVQKEQPDLILLDMVLPEINGMQILKNLKNNSGTKSIPVIIISNSGEHIEIENAKNLGIEDYLIKTEFDPSELLLKINSFFKKISPEEKEIKEEKNIPLSEKKFNSSNSGKFTKNSQNKTKVLVVEDDKFLRELISTKLSKEGLEVFPMITAEEALEFLKKDTAHLILLDLLLPGMNGFELLKEIKSRPETSDIPVVILSNLGEDSDKETAQKLGAKNFLIKAMYTPDEIVKEAKKIIGENYL